MFNEFKNVRVHVIYCTRICFDLTFKMLYGLVIVCLLFFFRH